MDSKFEKSYVDMHTRFFTNLGVDMDVTFLETRGVDIDVNTTFSKNRGVDMDLDTEFFQKRSKIELNPYCQISGK